MSAPLRCLDTSKAYQLLNGQHAVRLVLGLPSGAPEVHALTDITLSVPYGQILGVLGRNGAGKSTLLRILGGVYQPTSGTVICLGDIGSIFEMGFSSSPTMTGAQHASRFLELKGFSRPDLSRLLGEIHEFSELGDAFYEPIYTYSSGMAARLYFSTATAPEYSVYLIDEALSVGDEHFQAKCWRRIRQRLKQGACGVLVTHDWSAALRLCETSCILENGRIVAHGSSEDVIRGFLRQDLPGYLPGAKFLNLPNEVRLAPGKDADWQFDVQVTTSEPVVFLYSIERMQVGSGWDIALLSFEMPLPAGQGTHHLNLRIPELPVAPGAYYLNIFLSTPQKIHKGREPYDLRGWTYGSPIHLVVEGQAKEAICQLPIKWSYEELE